MAEINDYLKNLIVFQSADFESFLIKKFGLNTRDELRDYIIPTTRASVEASDANALVQSFGMDQAFIRWDALVILINEALVPKTEKALAPFSIVTDRIYYNGNCLIRMLMDELQDRS